MRQNPTACFSTLRFSEAASSSLFRWHDGDDRRDGHIGDGHETPTVGRDGAFLTALLRGDDDFVAGGIEAVTVANRLAQQRWYQALVTGDNLAQVASQTLENLRALDDASALPIFRPLLTYDKQEIIALAQRIGTYELSLQPYKDCCSLIARHPETRPKLEAVRNAESHLPMDALLERTLSELVVWEIGQESQATAGEKEKGLL